jgi:hypothetical protein
MDKPRTTRVTAPDDPTAPRIEAPRHPGKKPGRKREHGARRFIVRSISLPTHVETRLRHFMRDEQINVSAWLTLLIDADLKTRGYF